MNRRLVALAATLVIAGAACGGSSSTASPAASQAASQPAASQPAATPAATVAPTAAAEPVTLSLWHNYGTEANAKVTEALVKAYTAKNPNVTIELVSQPADNYFALLKAAAIAKSGPDLMTMWTGLFALQNQAYLEPLNQYIPIDTLKKFDRHRLVLEGPRRSTRAPSACRSTCSTTTASTTRTCSRRPGSRRSRPLGRALRGLRQAQGRRHPADDLRHRRPGAQRRLLPLLRPQLHDDVPAGRRLEEALQRRDRVDRPDDRRRSSPSGPTLKTKGCTNTDVLNTDSVASSRPARPR